jgi:hypothetical protein
MEEIEERTYNNTRSPELFILRRVSGTCPIALPNKFLENKIHLALSYGY